MPSLAGRDANRCSQVGLNMHAYAMGSSTVGLASGPTLLRAGRSCSMHAATLWVLIIIYQ